MSALDVYLNQYYEDPHGLEEYKLNFLKNHYYITINKILKCDFKDFQIGVTKNKNIIWFNNKNYPDFEIIFHHKSKNYYKIINKNLKNIELINIAHYNKPENKDKDEDKDEYKTKHENKEQKKYKKKYCINCINQ